MSTSLRFNNTSLLLRVTKSIKAQLCPTYPTLTQPQQRNFLQQRQHKKLQRFLTSFPTMMRNHARMQFACFSELKKIDWNCYTTLKKKLPGGWQKLEECVNSIRMSILSSKSWHPKCQSRRVSGRYSLEIVHLVVRFTPTLVLRNASRTTSFLVRVIKIIVYL